MLTPDMLRRESKTLGLSCEEIARMVGYAESYVKSMAIGHAPISKEFERRYRLVVSGLCG
jgi:predicted transcriptional regulator